MRKITIFATAMLAAGAAALPASAATMDHHRMHHHWMHHHMLHHNVALNSAARTTHGERQLPAADRPIKRDPVPVATLGYRPGPAFVPGDESDY